MIDSDNHAHARVVRRGLMSDGMTEILEGVQEGEQVVTVGRGAAEWAGRR